MTVALLGFVISMLALAVLGSPIWRDSRPQPELEVAWTPEQLARVEHECFGAAFRHDAEDVCSVCSPAVAEPPALPRGDEHMTAEQKAAAHRALFGNVQIGKRGEELDLTEFAMNTLAWFADRPQAVHRPLSAQEILQLAPQDWLLSHDRLLSRDSRLDPE